MIKYKGNNIFEELTGIRAIAAFMVFFHHNNIFREKKYGIFIHDFVNEFHVGVTIFFVLSGFLICYRYYENIEIRNKKWILKYIQNRIARIYPMYFLMTTITFLFIFFKSDNLSKDVVIYIMNITFLRGFFQSIAWTGIGPGWTLTVEECFYLSAPLILIFSRKVKLIIPFSVIFLTGVLLVFIFSHVNFYGFFVDYKFMLSYTFFGRCFEFLAGMSLALYYKNKTQYDSKSHYTIIAILWIITCIIMLGFVKGNEHIGVDKPVGIFINNIILPIGIAYLFLGLITEDTIIKKILSSKLFILLGKSSYVFYLIHMSFINDWVNANTGHNRIITFLSLILISILLFKTIEEPSNILIRKINLDKLFT